MTQVLESARATDCPTRRLLGVPIAAVTMREVLRRVEETIRYRGRLLIGVVNAAKVVNMRRDPGLREAVLSADMILADGQAVVWASRLLQQSLPERVAGIDLMHAMMRDGAERGYRVYFLGATQAVLDEAVSRIRSEHPGIVVAGSRNGYFNDDEAHEVVADIRASDADILLVAMSSPKKEQFLARWSRELDVPVCHGVGGAFDVVAGRVQRAPQFWQRFGLEWLYRVLQEPRRMWRRYLVTNTLFCAMVFGSLLRRLWPFPVQNASSRSS